MDKDKSGFDAYSKEYLISKVQMSPIGFFDLIVALGWIGAQLSDIKVLTNTATPFNKDHERTRSSTFARTPEIFSSPGWYRKRQELIRNLKTSCMVFESSRQRFDSTGLEF